MRLDDERHLPPFLIIDGENEQPLYFHSIERLPLDHFRSTEPELRDIRIGLNEAAGTLETDVADPEVPGIERIGHDDRQLIEIPRGADSGKDLSLRDQPIESPWFDIHDAQLAVRLLPETE